MALQLWIGVDANGLTAATAWLFTKGQAFGRSDTVTVSGGGMSLTLSTWNDVVRRATFTGPISEGSTYMVALARMGFANAPSSTCTLPAPFTLQLAAGMVLSRAKDLLVFTYTPSGTTDAMSWGVIGDCVSGGGMLTGDPGFFTIAPGALTDVTTKSCMATLSITRSHRGTSDPALGAGSVIDCGQNRSAAFTSNP